MTAILKIVMVVTTLLFSGCYFTSLHPVTENPVPGSDPALLGLWKTVATQSDNSQEENYLLFMEETDGHILVVLMEDYYRFSEIYRGFISDVNGDKYLNIKKVKSDEKKHVRHSDTGYFIVQYEITEGSQLNIRTLREAQIEKAVKQKVLAGRITRNRYTDDIRITAASERIAAYLASQTLSELLETTNMITAKKINELPAELIRTENE
ncbi:hypothetical protein K8S19_06375 [bacterium]|nr:hypothetical protein [bacterium]